MFQIEQNIPQGLACVLSHRHQSVLDIGGEKWVSGVVVPNGVCEKPLLEGHGAKPHSFF